LRRGTGQTLPAAPGAWRKRWWQSIFGREDQRSWRKVSAAAWVDPQSPQGLPPLRRQAEEHVQAATKLIEETGYHGRDRELAELRTQRNAA
jgi:hypothetical protein